MRERGRKTDRQTDRQTDGQSETETHRERQSETDRQTETEERALPCVHVKQNPHDISVNKRSSHTRATATTG